MCFVWVSNSASTCASWHSYVCSQVNSAEAVIRHKNHAEYKSCLLWRNFVKGVKIRTGSHILVALWYLFGLRTTQSAFKTRSPVHRRSNGWGCHGGATWSTMPPIQSPHADTKLTQTHVGVIHQEQCSRTLWLDWWSQESNCHPLLLDHLN